MTETAHTLETTDHQPVLMATGEPFRYSSFELAWIARGILEGRLKRVVRVVRPRGTR